MRRAFTVIEIIVTFVIVTILISFAIYSFKYSISNLKKAVYYMPNSILAYTTMDRIISGIYYYVVEQKKKYFVDFFDGHPQKVMFVTAAPFWSKQLSVGKFICKDDKLIYEEYLLYGKQSDYQHPENFPEDVNQVILYRRLSDCNFEYITNHGQTVKALKNEIPGAIRLKWGHNNRQFQYLFSIDSNYFYHKVYQERAKYGF